MPTAAAAAWTTGSSAWLPEGWTAAHVGHDGSQHFRRRAATRPSQSAPPACGAPPLREASLPSARDLVDAAPGGASERPCEPPHVAGDRSPNRHDRAARAGAPHLPDALVDELAAEGHLPSIEPTRAIVVLEDGRCFRPIDTRRTITKWIPAMREVSCALRPAQSHQIIEAFYLLMVERIPDSEARRAPELILPRYMFERGYTARWMGRYQQDADHVGSSALFRSFLGAPPVQDGAILGQGAQPAVRERRTTSGTRVQGAAVSTKRSTSGTASRAPLPALGGGGGAHARRRRLVLLLDARVPLLRSPSWDVRRGGGSEEDGTHIHPLNLQKQDQPRIWTLTPFRRSWDLLRRPPKGSDDNATSLCTPESPSLNCSSNFRMKFSRLLTKDTQDHDRDSDPCGGGSDADDGGDETR